ncbi:MAG: glycosyltransferase family 2 protein [Candidatus Onthomonas sp.]|nr:glycosyltransferase family 2 protein [Candidatus Onthomonas sp.]
MKQQENRLVSVIITTYKNEALLPRAIESVLHQTYPYIELIVVDDNDPESPSRRATEAVMEHYPSVCYLRHPENRNGAAARNTGIRAAKGTYIAFLDNDDLYLSDHVAQCVEALQKRPDCDCVLCDVLKICSGLCWDVIPAASGNLYRKLFFSETALGTGSNLFVSADAVWELNGFDESFLRHQDVEFGLRLSARYRTCSLSGIQIIKEMDGFSNAQPFEKFRSTKRHLWSKFQREIDAMTPEEQNRYFAGQYSALLYVACKEGVREQIRWTEEQLKGCRPLNGKERLIVTLTRLNLFSTYEALKLAVKKSRSRKLYHRVISRLAECDRKLLDSALKKPAQTEGREN